MIIALAISLIIMLAIMFVVSIFIEDLDSIPTLVLFFALILGIVCFYAGRKSVQQEAVIAGAAEYKQVVKDGEVSNDFVWKKSN